MYIPYVLHMLPAYAVTSVQACCIQDCHVSSSTECMLQALIRVIEDIVLTSHVRVCSPLSAIGLGDCSEHIANHLNKGNVVNPSVLADHLRR